MLTYKNFNAIAYIMYATTHNDSITQSYRIADVVCDVTKHDNTFVMNDEKFSSMREINKKMFEIAVANNDIRFNEDFTLRTQRVFLSDCLISAETRYYYEKSSSDDVLKLISTVVMLHYEHNDNKIELHIIDRKDSARSYSIEDENDLAIYEDFDNANDALQRVVDLLER